MAHTRQIYPLRNLFRFLMFLLLATYVSLVAYLWHQTVTKTRNELNYVNSYLVQAVRTTLKEHELILRGLGSELISEGSLTHAQKGRRLIERMRKIDPGIVGLGLARPDGQLILRSDMPKKTSLPNLAQEPDSKRSFQETLSSQHLRTGRPYYFKPLGDWVVPIRVAIRDNKGVIRAVMTAGYSIGTAITAWNNIALLPKVKVALIGDDFYPRYIQPLPAGPRNAILKKFFGSPITTPVIRKISNLKVNHAFFQINLPHSGGDNYLTYTRLPEYGLYSGAFIEHSVVVANWLRASLIPTALMVLIALSGTLAYRRAKEQQDRANSEIIKLSAWQEAVLDGADYSIISTDTRGTIVSFNKTAERMLGYRAEEMIGRKNPEMFHDSAEIEQRARELSREFNKTITPGFEVFVAKARQGEREEREWTYIHKDGTRFPAHLSLSPLTTDDDNIIGFMGISYDLSEKKTIQAYLRDSEVRYRTLFEHAGDANFLMQNERFIDCNQASLHMFGCNREQIVGETPIRYSPPTQPDGRASAEKAMDKIQAAYAGHTQFFEWRHIQYDGTPFDTEVTLNLVEIAGEPHLLATVRDITARKRNEDELERSRQELIQHNESLRLLNQLSDRLHSTLALDDILHETLQALLGLSNTPNIAIYLLQDDDHTQLHLAMSHGFPEEIAQLGKTLPMRGSLSGLALAEGKVLETTNIADDARLFPSVRAGLDSIGAHSGIIIPLFYQHQPLGSVNLIYANVRNFDQLEKETLTSLGTTLALAIANARHIENLAFQARHDSLTQLPNRILLHETVNRRIAGIRQTENRIALMLLDLDHFKEINDTLGHQIGDRVLVRVAERIEQFCSQYDAVTARLGGDEFAIVLQQYESTETAIAMAEEILHLLHQPFLVEGIELCLGASIGVAYCPDHGSDSHALLRAADVAMYQAKKHATGLIVYNSDFDDYSTERLTLANELVQAVDQNQLVLHYQPKINLASGGVIGFEALVRWNHPRLGLLYPSVFIHLAEMSEVIHPFTRSVIELAIHDKQQLHTLGYHQPIAINLSAINLADVRCLNCLHQALEDYALPPAEIEVELTETALMHEGDNALILLHKLNDMNIDIAIDDFGTGYSSLSYLRRLPIKALKIDKSFVVDMQDNKQDRAIVRSTIELAHNLELEVIAEGVESAATQQLLRTMGCDHAQGYGICRPLTIEKLVSWLNENHAHSLNSAETLP